MALKFKTYVYVRDWGAHSAETQGWLLQVE